MLTVKKIKDAFSILKNMGWRYTQFRLKHEMLKKTGLLKRNFPVSPDYKQYISLEEWKSNSGQFLFKSKQSLNIKCNPSDLIAERFRKIKEGKFNFFNSIEFNIGKDYDWISNPDTGFKYNISKHWTEIADYSEEAGDIKYVWEKSRFSYLYDIIRYDYHFNEDCSSFVFSEILSWINSNPVNQGPNYRCSQEISLRVLNWTFALYYYRDSYYLTDEIFNKIQFAIYWQIDHVYQNIDFSRIAVRNNHAITETLTLYLAGLFYPQFPDSSKWRKKGKQWFEEEIAYQIYEDGTFLQFSVNYHRVVVQLLTWAIVLSEKNSDPLSEAVYKRAKNSIEFLRTCMVDDNGKLPNYGANDGALFFKLNDFHYRDYRPTLNALAKSLKIDLGFRQSEDELWYGIDYNKCEKWQPSEGIHAFEKGGYFIFRETEALTFIRCGNHKDRPSQADNLHLDIWYKGQNIFCDAGSYKYNTDSETLKYFMGTASHNTVMLDDYGQMKKGARFIWYNWTQRRDVFYEENPDNYHFKGSIYAFKQVSQGIVHSREIIKIRNQPKWIIKDVIENKPAGVSMNQLWHLPVGHFTVNWKEDQNCEKVLKKGFVSELYGKKEACEIVAFRTKEDHILTEFEIAE